MYSIDGDMVTFTNGKHRQFGAQIAEVVDFEGTFVLRLAPDPFYNNENVYSFDYVGNLLWQIPHRPQVQGQCPYIGLCRKDFQFIEAFNWNGFAIVLHPRIGTIIQEGIHFNNVAPSRRTPPRRVWI